MVTATPTVTIANDSTNDVGKIIWGGITYNYDKGGFKNEIDIVSLTVETLGNENISTAIIFQNTPIYDGYHLYWIWISFSGEGDEGSAAGAWFWAGRYSGTTEESAWWVWGDYGNFTAFAQVNDAPKIDVVAKSLSWETKLEYWDDLSNSGIWTTQVWAWTPDGTSYAESIMSGTSYWDFYPNDDSSWESGDDSSTTSDTSSNGTQPSSSPGFEISTPILAINTILIAMRKNRR